MKNEYFTQRKLEEKLIDLTDKIVEDCLSDTYSETREFKVEFIDLTANITAEVNIELTGRSELVSFEFDIDSEASYLLFQENEKKPFSPNEINEIQQSLCY